MGVRRQRQVGVEADAPAIGEVGGRSVGHGRRTLPGQPGVTADDRIPPVKASPRAVQPSASASRCAGGCRARCWSPASGWPSSWPLPGAGRLGGHRGRAGAAGARPAGPTAPPGSRVAGRRLPRRPGPHRGRATSARPPRSTPRRPGGPPGRDADARAYLLLRPYLKRAVRVRDHRPGRPGAVLAGQHPAPRGAGPGAARARRRRMSRPPAGYGSAMASGGSKVWTVFSLGRGARRGRGREEGARHDLEGGDRQEPAGQPGRPRRRHLGGRALGGRQRHRGRARPDARAAPGGAATTPARPATCRPTCRRTTRTPTRRRPHQLSPRTTEGPQPRSGLRPFVVPSLRVRRSPCRSSSCCPPAGGGGAPGSSSCR